MNTTTDESSAYLNDATNLATWNVPRSIEQLRAFVSSREEVNDTEDFEF